MRIDSKEPAEQYPLMEKLIRSEELFWINEKAMVRRKDNPAFPFGEKDMKDAEARLIRFAPYLAVAFPETASAGGIIESPLKPIPVMKERMEEYYGRMLEGQVYLKCDSHLAVSGSVKARGGIYEVLKLAEHLAIENGLLSQGDDYSRLNGEAAKRFFSKYSVAVGSTGNLGLSIGIISAKLGFKVTVHMSADARKWKKELLREKGVVVIEYPDDYQKAVAEGRKEAEADPFCHFVDDESSKDLFLGYSTAAIRLARQMEAQGISVDEAHPLAVYLPCGVGGAPGGIAFGLKQLFGSNVHCIFAEPTHAPCMTLGMMTGKNEKISIKDIGLDGLTAADGLAVGRPSALVCNIMETMLAGCYTVADPELFKLLAMLADSENIYVEPSATAGFPGIVRVLNDEAYLQKAGLAEKLGNVTHIVWATGGSMVPRLEMEEYYRKGKKISDC